MYKLKVNVKWLFFFYISSRKCIVDNACLLFIETIIYSELFGVFHCFQGTVSGSVFTFFTKAIFSRASCGTFRGRL